jgi:subtilase family serine protease
MRLQPVIARLLASALLAATASSALLNAQRATPARPLIVERVDEGSLATLRGNTRPEARAAYDRGAVTPALPMPGMILVLRRSPEREAAIEAFAESQQDPSSPNYHHWLTAAQQGEKFGPAQSDIAAVTTWLQNRGFTIDNIAKNRMTIQFSGTASQVQSAFHTEIHNLNVKGESHIANMSDPQIPAALSAAVVGIQALHNFYPHPLHHLGAQVRRNSETGKWERISAPAAAAQAKSSVAPNAKTVDLPLFNTVGPDGDIEDIGPYDFATIYNLLPLWNASTPIDGTGQKIAIVGTSDINPADVTTFRAAFGLPAYASPTGSTPGLSIIHPNTPPGDCSPVSSNCINELIENSLDVEWAGAIAQKANIILVASSGGSGSTYTADPVYVSANYIVENNIASIMNVSYGECELALGTAGNAAYNTMWQTASTAGISVFVASGDEGSASCDAGNDTSLPYGAQFGLSVSGVASTPYNTAVGGTDFNWSWLNNGESTYWNTSNSSGTLASAKGYIPESPWNSTCSNSFFDTYVNQAISENYNAATICNDFGTGVITSGGSADYGLVDIVGGSGGASGCTTSMNSSLSSCTGGYPKPGWQAGITGIPTDSKRDIPDLSFFAANGFSGSAYVICVSANGGCSYTAGTEPIGEEVGGTSVSSPIMAGVMALINQKVGSPQGLPNKALYGLAAEQNYSSCSSETVTAGSSCIFNDIDTGTIAMPCAAGSADCTLTKTTDSFGILSGYDTTKGFDLATGLGSLNIANAVNNFPIPEVTGASYTLVAADVSLSAGASKTSAITATGANGYIGPNFVLINGCTLVKSPTGATHAPTCAITTAAVTFAAGSSTGSGGVVTISTTAPTTSSVRKAALDNSAPWAGGAGAVAVAGLLLFIPGRLRKWRSLLGVFLLVATLGVLSGCSGGGGGGGTTTIPGTTAGSYTFTITGQDAAGTSQSATLNLTVN